MNLGSDASSGATPRPGGPQPGVSTRSRAGAGEVFDDGQAAKLVEAGPEHWWFHSKAAFVVSALDRWTADRRTEVLVDLGAGSGTVTSALREIATTVIAIDGSPELANRAHSEFGLVASVANVGHAPLRDGCADVVALLDVIEHLERPMTALQEARRVLRPGGHLVVTVPAHNWLWSRADEFLGHHRRYTRRLLTEQLREAGFGVCHMTHVFSWLVVPVAIQRRIARRIDRQLGVSTKSSLVTRAARRLTAVERRIVRHRSLPVGTSIVAVAAELTSNRSS